jgi:uncharacterized protein YdbL (DUF1318 family)
MQVNHPLKKPAFLPRSKSSATLAALAALACALAATACVTVNVNFPEATVQKASDDYVKDLYRAKEKGRIEPAVTPQASASPTAGSSWFIANAMAAEIPSSFRMDNAAISAVKQSQAGRIGQIAAAARAGQVGETNDGKLAVDPGNTLKPLLKKGVQPLVDAENKDREKLYKEVIELNSMSKNRLKDVEKSFSRSFQDAAPAGTWLQDESGKWAQKK